jgi:endonuclease YncB( thermonuclease family)
LNKIRLPHLLKETLFLLLLAGLGALNYGWAIWPELGTIAVLLNAVVITGILLAAGGMALIRKLLPCMLVCIGILSVITPSYAEITGRASVIDGDTIEIHGQRIRFMGIDAPESSQLCEADGKKYRCGQQAALALDGYIAGKTVRCEEKTRDKYKRIVAECFMGDDSLNAWMVSQGWALAYREYSNAFVSQEEKAKAGKLGIWKGTFQNPWDFRHGPVPEEKTVTGDCLIKGNINGKGSRIYHMPGTSWYGKTKIDTGNGERWFCSEEEARTEGWRKAR